MMKHEIINGNINLIPTKLPSFFSSYLDLSERSKRNNLTNISQESNSNPVEYFLKLFNLPL